MPFRQLTETAARWHRRAVRRHRLRHNIRRALATGRPYRADAITPNMFREAAKPFWEF